MAAMDSDPRLRISRDIARKKVTAKPRKADLLDAELREMVVEIDEDGTGLTDWEVEFIGDLIDKDVLTFSEKQEAVIRRIHGERL